MSYKTEDYLSPRQIVTLQDINRLILGFTETNDTAFTHNLEKLISALSLTHTVVQKVYVEEKVRTIFGEAERNP